MFQKSFLSNIVFLSIFILSSQLHASNLTPSGSFAGQKYIVLFTSGTDCRITQFAAAKIDNPVRIVGKVAGSGICAAGVNEDERLRALKLCHINRISWQDVYDDITMKKETEADGRMVIAENFSLVSKSNGDGEFMWSPYISIDWLCFY